MKRPITSILVVIVVAMMLLPAIASAVDGKKIEPRYVPCQGISGRVTDGVTGDPLVNATVTGGGDEVLSGSNGYYFLSITTYGTYTVTISKTGFQTESNSVSIDREWGIGSWYKALTHSNGLYGRVRSTDTNALLGGATISIINYNDYVSVWIDCATTDGNGFYYYAIYPDWFGVMAEKDGMWCHYKEMTINQYGVYDYDFYLRTSTYEDVDVSAIYFNTTIVNDPNIEITNVEMTYSASSTVTFGYSGSAAFGWAVDNVYTFTSIGSVNSAMPAGKNCGRIWAHVECSGITEGEWGDDYSATCYYVKEVLSITSLFYSLTDPVQSNDGRFGTWMYLGPQTPNSQSVYESSATLNSALFDLEYNAYGVPVTLSVDRSTSSTAGAYCGFSLYNADTSKMLGYKFFFEATEANHGIIGHVCFYSYA